MMVRSADSQRSVSKEEAPIQPPESATTQVVAADSTTITQEDATSERAVSSLIATQEEASSEVTTAFAMQKHEETSSEISNASTDITQEEAPFEKVVSSAIVTQEETSSEVSSIMTSISSDATINGAESDASSRVTEIDPVTSLAKDSAYLREDRIGEEMAKLLDLRAKLKTAEEELANVISELETNLLNLRNVVHVKKIMYEHLKKELETTRKEWAEAYNEYLNTDQRRKSELEERSRIIEEIRKGIEEIGKIVRSQVSDMELKRFTE
jgi:hypothetical protein